MKKPDEELFYPGALPQTPPFSPPLGERGEARHANLQKTGTRSLSQKHRNFFQLNYVLRHKRLINNQKYDLIN
jgi:hypothetical protein